MSRPGTRLTRADSSDGRNTSMMEVSCDGRYQAAERRRGRCGEGFVLSVSAKRECWDSAVAESFSPPSNESSSMRARGPRESDFAALSSSTSRAGTTRAGCTRPLATSVPLSMKLSTATPTVRRHNQPNQPVRQSGSSPVPHGA